MVKSIQSETKRRLYLHIYFRHIKSIVLLDAYNGRLNMHLLSKKFLLLSLISCSNIQCVKINPFVWFAEHDVVITDVSNTSVIPVSAIKKPHSIKELKHIVMTATCPISVAGGRFSQGGQIAYRHGLVVDITNLKAIINFDPQAKTITVQTGITWRAIQNAIDPYNLSVKVMQSYNDFTVGGSLSVNIHGRDINYGPLIDTIQSIKVLLADGSIVDASRNQNQDIFSAAIGGYGAIGIITEATISLTDNVKMKQIIKQMPIEEYAQHFFNEVKNNPNAILHNGNLYPNDFKTVGAITWYKTDEQLTDETHLRPFASFYPLQMLGEQMLRRIGFLKKFRPSFELKFLQEKRINWRNYEMSRTVNTLEPLVRFPTTTVLQEYFIPVQNIIQFINQLRTLTNTYGINILNTSIRYVPANTESLLTYAPQESFAFVLYINLVNTDEKLAHAQEWTGRLIDAAVNCGGTYYLPYQLFGTMNQIEKAYPRLHELRTIKKKYDSKNKFSNSLVSKYIA